MGSEMCIRDRSRRRFINICQTGLFAKKNGNLSLGAGSKLGAENARIPDSGPHSTSLLGNPNDHRACNGKTLFCLLISRANTLLSFKRGFSHSLISRLNRPSEIYIGFFKTSFMEKNFCKRKIY